MAIASRIVRPAAARSFRTRIRGLRRLGGVEHVARAGAVALVLVTGGGRKRRLEVVAVFLARRVGAERDRAVLVRERAQVERAVVGVAARWCPRIRAVGTV